MLRHYVTALVLKCDQQRHNLARHSLFFSLFLFELPRFRVVFVFGGVTRTCASELTFCPFSLFRILSCIVVAAWLLLKRMYWGF